MNILFFLGAVFLILMFWGCFKAMLILVLPSQNSWFALAHAVTYTPPLPPEFVSLSRAAKIEFIMNFFDTCHVTEIS